MDYFKIDGRVYDVIVTAIDESFNILFSEKTGRTMAPGAPMVLDPLGTFFGHKVTVQRKSGRELEYDDLYNKVSTGTRIGRDVEIVHNQETIKYKAYVSSGGRSLKKIGKDGKVYWGELQLNIVPLEAQVLPE